LQIIKSPRSSSATESCIGGIDALVFSGGIGAHAGGIRVEMAEAIAMLPF
jgi:acetate kinase